MSSLKRVARGEWSEGQNVEVQPEKRVRLEEVSARIRSGETRHGNTREGVPHAMPERHASSHFAESHAGKGAMHARTQETQLKDLAGELSWVSSLTLGGTKYVFHFDASDSIKTLPHDDLANETGVAIQMHLSDGKAVWQVIWPSAHAGEENVVAAFDHVERALQVHSEDDKPTALRPTYTVDVDQEKGLLTVCWVSTHPQKRGKMQLKMIALSHPTAVQDMMKKYVPQLLSSLSKRRLFYSNVSKQVSDQNELALAESKTLDERAKETQKLKQRTLMQLLRLRHAKDAEAKTREGTANI
mmetsp:Transcript_80393/g.117853  ORF Transcript_80393/g.117853 Transcript_80393/m.117853 type:complete len:300 (+) Transcript_80393:105-1004(+)